LWQITRIKSVSFFKTKILRQKIVQKIKDLYRKKHIHASYSYYKSILQSVRKTVYYIKQLFSLSPRFIFHLSLIMVVVFISFSSTLASKKQVGNVITDKILPVGTSKEASVRTLATLASAVDSLSGLEVNQEINVFVEPSLATTSETCLAKPTYPETVISEKQREGIITYIVESGDTLWSIASKFQISTDTVKWANNIEDEDMIKDGQSLSILPVSGVLHIMQAGETVDGIAVFYSASPELIVKQNKLKSKEDIKEGLGLIVPDGKKPEPPKPEPEPEPQPQPADNNSIATNYISSYSYYGGAGGLTGSIGYAKCGGNCVNEPGVKNPGLGNPSDWPVLTYTPYIGATALWTYNHTGVVTGIWSNGDIEVRHQNYCGGQHRFPRSAFRGFR